MTEKEITMTIKSFLDDPEKDWAAFHVLYMDLKRYEKKYSSMELTELLKRILPSEEY